MRPAPTWFGVRRHIIDDSFGGGGEVLDPELSGGSGTFRGYAYGLGVRCLGFWFSIGVCGIYLVFVLQAAIACSFFFFFFFPYVTTTFTGNKYLPQLVCLVFFLSFLNLYTFLKRRFLGQPLGINYM